MITLDTGIQSAQRNMEIDADLLKEMENKPQPILHHYEWENHTITYGLLTKPEHFLDLNACKKEGISLAKRPTGGGILSHFSDLAFSLIIPNGHPLVSMNTLNNYHTVNQAVIESLKPFGVQGTLLPSEPTPKDNACKSFCMAKPTIYDVMVNKQKLGGAAQRKTRFGLLHQGSISICPPDFSLMKKLVLPNTFVIKEMNDHSFYLSNDLSQLISLREEIKKSLSKTLKDLFT
ncbi:hypothetical protein N9Y92_00950 [Chlamydiales bacterium]|nr:hypothetical protein [Chlamydiales bacterium]